MSVQSCSTLRFQRICIFADLDKIQHLIPAKLDPIQRNMSLKALSKEEVCVNLFRDVDQSIHWYAMSTWETGKEELSTEVITLKENYRKSMRVTKYCNRFLNRGDVLIGVLGKHVKHITIATAVEKIKDLRRSDVTVLIVKDEEDLKSFEQIIKTVFQI